MNNEASLQAFIEWSMGGGLREYTCPQDAQSYLESGNELSLAASMLNLQESELIAYTMEVWIVHRLAELETYCLPSGKLKEMLREIIDQNS